MRAIFLSITFCLISSISLGKTVLWKDLVENPGDGLVYNKFLTMPFTGAAKTTYESGQLKTVFNFIDGETQGLGEEYYEGGQLKSKFNLTDGKLNGPHETYHENGQLKYRWNYKDGKMHGLQKDYAEDGSMSFSIKYENGVCVPN